LSWPIPPSVCKRLQEELLMKCFGNTWFNSSLHFTEEWKWLPMNGEQLHF
jgi:hypothetical protein